MLPLDNILSAVVFLPLVGALLILLTVNGDSEKAQKTARYTAFWTTLVTFAVSLVIWQNYDPSVHTYQFVEKHEWFAGYNIFYFLGLDGLSIFFILLNCFLMPICILASWHIDKRVKEYMVCFLLLETFVNGVFCSLDLVLFYLFFEGMLIPMYLLIGIWGGAQRVYAAFKFFLYTLLGSVLFLIAVLFLYSQFGTSDIPELMTKAPHILLDTQKWLWLALFASFAVKVPMWPVHTWLPDAHVQAPTAGSVILAGILLKMGGYGFLRLSLPLFPEASHYFAPLVFGLSVVAIIYTSLVALMQEDMKKLIAYSSVAHMGFVTIGIFAFNQQGIEGSVFQMISHGLVSGALFLCVGVLYDRLHTKEIAKFGGLVERMPYFAGVYMLFTMASVGLPGTSGFVGEFLSLLGTFQANTTVAALSATGVVLGAAYMLWLYRRVMFGELVRNELKTVSDLEAREVLYFVPVMILVVLIGIYPEPVLGGMRESVSHLLGQVKTAGMDSKTIVSSIAGVMFK